MGDGDKTAVKERIADEDFGVAAFLLFSGNLARLQASEIKSPNGTRLLLIGRFTLENMPLQDEAVRKARVALESLFSFSRAEKTASASAKSVWFRPPSLK